MISANNVTLRVGKKALFEDVNIKFTEGNCYGLIGANGAGKSTFLKILSGQLEPTNGEVAITPGQRLSFLQQDHFKYDEYTVLDTVIMGNKRLYDIMKEKDAIYMKEEFTDEDGIKAAINVKKAHPDWNVEPEIMIPLVGDVKELKFVKKIVVETADAEIAAANSDLNYEVGTMIEIPRAALTADEIAANADFFCFGTNDLTQMTYGFSRDDAGKFLDAYYDKKIFENDPFAKLDQVGVGKLMEMAIKLGKPVNPDLHIGICGEHGGDPTSVEFCHKIGLDYVSCSPFRVPIARLAAAQAAIAEKNA